MKTGNSPMQNLALASSCYLARVSVDVHSSDCFVSMDGPNTFKTAFVIRTCGALSKGPPDECHHCVRRIMSACLSIELSSGRTT